MKTYGNDDGRSTGAPKFQVGNRFTPRRVTLKWLFIYNSINIHGIISSLGTKNM